MERGRRWDFLLVWKNWRVVVHRLQMSKYIRNKFLRTDKKPLPSSVCFRGIIVYLHNFWISLSFRNMLKTTLELAQKLGKSVAIYVDKRKSTDSFISLSGNNLSYDRGSETINRERSEIVANAWYVESMCYLQRNDCVTWTIALSRW